jgi:hypothetical protein
MSPLTGKHERRLDQDLAGLPQSIEPRRDLWPGIAARLESGRVRPARRWAWQAAAAVLLVASSSIVTLQLVKSRVPAVADAPASAPVPSAMPAAFGPGHALDPEYLAAKEQLAEMLAQRVDAMPASARSKLAANLAELQRATAEINAALALQPGDPLLEELLLNAYQAELGVMANVNQLTRLNGTVNQTDSARIRL